MFFFHDLDALVFTFYESNITSTLWNCFALNVFFRMQLAWSWTFSDEVLLQVEIYRVHFYLAPVLHLSFTKR